MTISKTEDQSSITVHIRGWLDAETTPELHAYMETLPETKNLFFDFAELEYISSAGVREAVAAYRRQKAKAGSFALINVGPEIAEVFGMTGLDKKLDIRKA